MPTFEERIDALEQKAISHKLFNIPGTSLSRAIDSNSDAKSPVIKWTIGIGGLGQPKRWFTEDTIEQAVSTAERYVEAQVLSQLTPGRRS